MKEINSESHRLISSVLLHNADQLQSHVFIGRSKWLCQITYSVDALIRATDNCMSFG